MSTGLAVLLATVACTLLGALVPWAIARLPEPKPRPEQELDEARRAEGPKEPYAEIAATPRLGPLSAGASGLIGATVALRVGADPVLVGLVLLVPVGVLLAVVDWRTRLLPRVVVLPATGVLLLLAVLDLLLGGDSADLVRALIGLAVARTFYWVLWFVRSAGMGFGDVRLAALLGLTLGHLGWAELAVGGYAGFLVFAVPGLTLALVRRDRSLLRRAYPFGPFMLVGAVLGVLLGDPVAGLAAGRG